MSEAKRLDQTEPGGKYLNVTQDRWIDANGQDLGPVEDEVTLTDEIEPIFAADHRDHEGNVIDTAETDTAEEGEAEASGATPESEQPEKPAKRTRTPKAAD